jgi:hypothetical protein
VSAPNFVEVENLENLLDSIATNLFAAKFHGSLKKNHHMVDSWVQNQKGGSFGN